MSRNTSNARHPNNGIAHPNQRTISRGHSTRREVQRTESRFDRFVGRAIRSSTSEPILLHAPAAIGKTTTTIKNAPHWHPTTYFAPRDDLKRQAKSIAEEVGHSVEILPSAPKHCPAFDTGSPCYNKEAVKLWEHGASPSDIHRELSLHPNQRCEYNQRKDRIRNSLGDIDLLVGDPLHAYPRRIVDDRLVIFDELPVERFESTHEKVHKQVSNWLSQGFTTDLLPDGLSSAGDAIQMRGTKKGRKALDTLKGISAISAKEIRQSNSAFHHHAALALAAILGDGYLGNNYRVSDHVQSRLVFDTHTHDVSIFQAPGLGRARGILGLDATPRPSLWNLLMNRREFGIWQPFDPSSQEWRAYHRDILGLDVKQLGTALKPYDGSNQTLKRDEAVLRFIRQKEGIKPDLITTKSAIEEYRENGLLDFVDDYCNFRSVKSSNIFQGDSHTVGVIQGCPHPGDAVIKRWCAILGKPPNITGRGDSKDYGGKIQNSVARHFTHDLVYHAVMRFARGDTPATVYLNTTAADEWLSPDQSLTQRFDNNWNSFVGVEGAIRDNLQQTGQSNITTLANATGYSKNRVGEGVNNLDANPHSPIERRERLGPKPDKVVWTTK